MFIGGSRHSSSSPICASSPSPNNNLRQEQQYQSPTTFSTQPSLPSPQSDNGTAKQSLLGRRPESCRSNSAHSFVISITSPTGMEIGLPKEGNLRTNGRKIGGGCQWRKWLLPVLLALIMVAALLAILALNYLAWMRLDFLENNQTVDRQSHNLELANLKRHQNLLLALQEEAHRKEASAREEFMAEMLGKIAKVEEKQKVIAIALGSTSPVVAALEKIGRERPAQRSVPTTSSSTPLPTGTTASREFGNFVVYVNGQPISGREFLSNQQIHLDKTIGK